MPASFYNVMPMELTALAGLRLWLVLVVPGGGLSYDIVDVFQFFFA